MIEPVGQLLLQEGLIQRAQLDEALALQEREGGKIIEILVRLKHLDKDALHRVLSKQPGMAAIELSRVQIDRELLNLIPREMALTELVLPIDRLGKLLTVGMACPLDAVTIAAVEKHTGLKVKAMLCRMDDIHAAVSRYYRSGLEFENALPTFELPERHGGRRSDYGDKIASLDSLLVHPDHARHLRDLASDPSVSPQDLALTASQDPGLGALLLRTANSAAYGLPRQVDSIPMAVSLIGRSGVAEIAARCVNGTANTETMRPMYDRAQRASIAAAALAKVSGRVGRSAAHTAGLLHEIGRFALATADPKKYAGISAAAHLAEAAKAEQEAYGMAHPQAGALLGEAWRLPPTLVAALADYLAVANASEQHRALAAVMVLAARAANEGSADAVLGMERDALQILGLQAAAASNAVRQAFGE
jgi:HD-like signal output (HDOD) protein